MKSFAPNQYSPFEILMSIVFGISGMLQIFIGPSPGSSSTLLPMPFRLFWLALLVIGCILTLCGVSVDKVWGYIVERVGLLATGWSIVVFGLAIMYAQLAKGGYTPTMIAGGPLIVLLGVAFLWKARQVRGLLKALK